MHLCQLMIHPSRCICRNACAGSKGRTADERADPYKSELGMLVLDP